MGRRYKPGFTIIEIMVAILLLSASLVAIFGAQFAAVSSTNFARNITQATQLGRCKMSELEILFVQDGFQEGDIDESGECCEFLEGEQKTEFSCSWEIKTIVFPDMSEMMSEDDSDEGMLDDGDSSDMMADMGMGAVGALLPMFTEILQQAIRRVTVTVEWPQGNQTKSFELIQYVVHPTQGPLQLLQEANSANEMMEELDASGNLPSGNGILPSMTGTSSNSGGGSR